MRPVLLVVLACSCSEAAVERAAAPDAGAPVDAGVVAREDAAAPFDRDDELDAGTFVPAVYVCDKAGCDRDRDGGSCDLLGSACPCEVAEGCTGGPGLSVAICPYQYRYCVGLAACVTTARYYSRCPY